MTTRAHIEKVTEHVPAKATLAIAEALLEDDAKDRRAGARNFAMKADAVIAALIDAIEAAGGLIVFGEGAKSRAPERNVLEAADRVVTGFEAFNDAEHNRQDCTECNNEGPWYECPRCSETVGELLNSHLLAIQEYKAFRAATLGRQEGELVERIASFVANWNGGTADGDTSLIADEIRRRFTHSPDAGDGMERAARIADEFASETNDDGVPVWKPAAIFAANEIAGRIRNRSAAHTDKGSEG